LRATFLAVLLDANSTASLQSAIELANTSLRKDDYVPWDRTTPSQYRGGPRELLSVEIAIQGGFALFRPEPADRAAHWALELSSAPSPRAVVLYMGPEMDSVPGVGTVFRGESGDEALLKIYADREPWLKIGTAEDTEVAYPIPSIMTERSATVMTKLEPYLGSMAPALNVALSRCLEGGSPSPELPLAALGLTKVFPTPEKSLRFIHRDSPLFRKASPSPTGRGIK